jgi:hypothetical protein
MLGLKGFLGNLHTGPIGALAGGLGAAVTGQPTDAGIDRGAAVQPHGACASCKGRRSDVAVAAAAKNPALMTELIKQHYGPQTVTSLGNGYVWDQKTGKADQGLRAGRKGSYLAGRGLYLQPGKRERWSAPIRQRGKKDTPQAQMAQREQALQARGLDPKDPRNQQFVLTGKFPREDAQPLTATDKKAILEADDAVMAATNVIGNLQKIKELSKKAYEGPLAGVRGYATSLMGSEAGTATSEMGQPDHVECAAAAQVDFRRKPDRRRARHPAQDPGRIQPAGPRAPEDF